MPIIGPPDPNVIIPSQVLPKANPSGQKNFRQMCGEVQEWNPDAPPTQVEEWIRTAYRSLIDERMWYGLLIRGQILVPSVYSTGIATVVHGNNVVTGVNTNWNDAMVGRQFCAGFTTGFYTIASVQGPTSMTLDLAYGGVSMINVGYRILQAFVTPGVNIKFFKEVVNQRQGYRLFTNVPQAVLNHADTWRTAQGWTFLLSPKETNAAGIQTFELYPVPTFQQTFPYLAYVQPPDLVDDESFVYPYFRTDLLVTRAKVNALLFRGKNSKYYDPTTAGFFMNEYTNELEKFKRADDCMDMKDLKWDYEKFPLSQQGALFLQSHAGGMGEL